VADIAVARAGGSVLCGWCRGFANWWLSELRSAVPSNWLDWAGGEATLRVLVRRDKDFIVCSLASATGLSESRLPSNNFGAAALDDWLVERGLTREKVLIGAVLGRDLFLRRHLSVPNAALASLPRILEQEVLRRTPFDLSDIWHAALPSVSEDAVIHNVCHWIIRKDRAQAALDELGLSANDVDFLAAATGSAAAPVISFRPTTNDDPPWAIRAIRLLFVTALAAVVMGFVIFEWAQSSVETAVETSLAEIRQDGRGGGDGSNPAARLAAIKAEAGMLDVWDELSRILPDHTFLNELRIVGGKVTVSGFSGDAAHLVRIIDRSPLFSDAALAAAITPDAAEHKDRFTISFRVRGGQIEIWDGNGRNSAP
jgi:general secretion pathway protein L